MRFKLACPHCAKALSAPQKLLGQQIDCPHCKRRFTILPQGPKTDARPETAPRQAAPTFAPQQFSWSPQKSDSTKIEPGRRQSDATPPVGNATVPCSASPPLPPQPPAANPSKTPIGVLAGTLAAIGAAIALFFKKGGFLVIANIVARLLRDPNQAAVAFLIVGALLAAGFCVWIYDSSTKRTGGNRNLNKPIDVNPASICSPSVGAQAPPLSGDALQATAPLTGAATVAPPVFGVGIKHSDDWWLLFAGQTSGPYSTSALIDAVETGDFSPATLVCPVGGQGWRAIADCPQLLQGSNTPAVAPNKNSTPL